MTKREAKTHVVFHMPNTEENYKTLCGFYIERVGDEYRRRQIRRVDRWRKIWLEVNVAKPGVPPTCKRCREEQEAMTRNIGRCAPPAPPVPDTLWGEPDDEVLRGESRGDGIMRALEGRDLHELPATIEIEEYQRMAVTIPGYTLEVLLERLDEEHGNPEGPGTEPTPRMRAAETVFHDIVSQEYRSWQCEAVPGTRETVDVRSWIEEHAPQWVGRVTVV